MRLLPSCLALLCWLPALAADPLALATHGRHTPPFYEIGSDGKARGACPELLQAMSDARPGLVFTGTETLMSLSLIEKALAQRRIDVVCSLGRTAQREAIADFLIPVWQTQHKVMVRRDDPVSIASLEELAAHSREQPVIVKRSSVYADRLRLAGVLIDDSSSDNDGMLRKLLGQRGRFIYTDQQQLAVLQREPGMAERLRILPARLHSETLYLVVDKALPATARQTLQGAFEAVRASGRLRAIQLKYALDPGDKQDE
ncbi:substrate-binding periplasmic protein [Chitinilyticum litopenaei]|uniref:substrate-binding periplasmic protein n=1 Tax=Chitinilyticum litopenaei TaxID=1121276 RepID=UPI0003F561FC|nr:transporter substrate-binding domain-containing protein [Chitinilyticum litopenaei]